MMSECFKRFGMTPEQIAERYAPICQSFIDELRDKGCPTELAAFLASKSAEALVHATGQADIAAQIASGFLLLHIEMGGTGLEVVAVPPQAELN